MRTQTSRRRLAKALFWASGKLRWIKTPGRTYKVVSFDPFITEKADIHWLPWAPSRKLMTWSMHLDWHHWDHWACHHEKCDPVPCAVCGGWLCGIDLEGE